MRHIRIFLFAAIAFLGLAPRLALCQSGDAQPTGQAASIEEIIKAAHEAAAEGDWASAESRLREATRLEPKQGLWRIQLTLALGQQKKWKEVLTEIDTLALYQAIDWILTINEKMVDGKVAFVDTGVFGDEKRGILRYVKAVKENKRVDSIARDIGARLDEFARKNRIALTYDISKLKSKHFASGNTPDVTSEFIDFYNSRYKD